MDKNMIKIDDLLRQRLGDAEEQERPGAWMNMKDLLDKQMPVSKVGGAVNWRRMFAYVAGIALLAAISVGGYEMSESFSTKGSIAGNHNNNTPAQTPVTGLAGAAINSLPDTRQDAIAEQTTPATDVANNSLATAQPGANTANGQKRVVANNATHNNVEAASSRKDLTNSKLASATQTSAATKADTKDVRNDIDKNQTAKKDKAPSNNIGGTDNTAGNRSPVKKDNTPTAAGTEKNNNTKAQNPVSGALAANSTGANKPQNNTAAAEPKYKEVPYKKIERQEHVDKNGRPVMDTIFNGEDVMKVRQDEMLALNKTNDENSGSNMMPSSAAPAQKDESGAEGSASQKQGNSNISGKTSRNTASHRFEEMVRNAKFRMGNVKFYPGVVAGANVALNGNAGFQVGLAGKLAVSDRWAILTEVKYAYHFNNKKVNMQDDYITNVKPTVINGQSVYTYDSMEHYFNFTSYSSFELPLMITYTKGRFIYMAGANFRYNMKISSLQEVEQIYLNEKPYYSTSDPKFNSEQKVLLSDFSPNLNIGPMLGFGYQCTPGFRLDGRISQSVWNNVSTVGQKEISKGLYNMPQFQVNLTFRFAGNSNRKPYKRPR